MKRLFLLITLIFGGCTFDPPPLPTLQQPEAGVFMVGDTLYLKFSESIDPETLEIRIWPVGPEDITLENEFVEGLEPSLKLCSPADSPCEGVTLALNEENTELSILIESDIFAKVKVPWRLEVAPGLKDEKGVATSAAYYFDFQFAPGDNLISTGEVSFDSDFFVLLSVIEEPLPAILNFLCDMQALSDGNIRITCANGSTVSGAPKNTANPEELFVDETGNGFAIFAQGVVTKDGDTRFLQTEPFPVNLSIGPINIILEDVRLSGVVHHGIEEPPDYPVVADADWIEGTISYAKIVLDAGTGEPFEYPPGNSTFFAQAIPPSVLPEGIPLVCGDHCGLVQTQCFPPESFPGEGFCEALEGEETR